MKHTNYNDILPFGCSVYDSPATIPDESEVVFKFGEKFYVPLFQFRMDPRYLHPIVRLVGEEMDKRPFFDVTTRVGISRRSLWWITKQQANPTNPRHIKPYEIMHATSLTMHKYMLDCADKYLL